MSANDNEAGRQAAMKVASAGPTNPGDEAPPGTPGTGEDVCPDCNGTGRQDGNPCRTCNGTGKVVKGVGGG